MRKARNNPVVCWTEIEGILIGTPTSLSHIHTYTHRYIYREKVKILFIKCKRIKVNDCFNHDPLIDAKISGLEFEKNQDIRICMCICIISSKAPKIFIN